MVLCDRSLKIDFSVAAADHPGPSRPFCLMWPVPQFSGTGYIRAFGLMWPVLQILVIPGSQNHIPPPMIFLKTIQIDTFVIKKLISAEEASRGGGPNRSPGAPVFRDRLHNSIRSYVAGPSNFGHPGVPKSYTPPMFFLKTIQIYIF